jgi:hypothetical protein
MASREPNAPQDASAVSPGSGLISIAGRETSLTIAQHVSADGALWATAGRRIVKGTEREGWHTVAEFPRCYPRDIFGWPRLAQRAARADKCNVYENAGGAVVGIRGGAVYRVESGEVHKLAEIQGDSVLHRGLCEDPDGCIYFGEYFMNPERGPVRIWRTDPNIQSVIVAYEFKSQSIRHVHGIYRDPFDSAALWATTGDFAGQCYILQTRDRFKTIRSYGDGTQKWRAVALFFTEKHVTWLTDSNLEQNYACRMDRVSGELELGQEIDCPGWYGATTEEGISVGFTTVETGPGVKRQESSVLISEDAFHWREAMTFRKDPYRPVRVFKYGVISCPSGNMSNSRFWISGEGLTGLDGSCMRLEIRN